MSNTKRTLNRLTISRHDFEKCQQFLEQRPNHTYGTAAYEALLLCAIVFYARPFSNNEKDSNAEAEPRVDNTVLDQLNSEEQVLHKRLVLLRNKVVAHAEWAYHPTGVTDNAVISSMPFSIWSHFPHTVDVQEFVGLVKKVLLRAHHLTADKLRNMP